ncbi:MAG: DUF58 domain-containing protein [Chloroflexota bacterium]
MEYTIRLRQPGFTYVAAFLLGLQLMEPSRAWMVLLVAFGGTWLLALLWVHSLGRNLQLRRERHIGWVQAGGQIEERFTLSNHSFFPALWLEIRDRSTLPGYNVNTTLSVRGGDLKLWSVPGACNQRGLYFLGDAELISGDPFGIYEVTVHDTVQTSLIVLPQVAPIPKLVITTAGAYGEGKPRPSSLHQTVSAAAVREYRPEDSLRLIHWPTTARMNKTFVKLMDNAPDANWWMVLDLDSRAMLGEGWDSTEELGVSLAASLADFGLRGRKSVGLISNSSTLTWLPPQKGEGQRWEILHALALVKPVQTPLSTLIERVTVELGRNHSLIIITASLDLTWMQSLRTLQSRGVIPTVLLLDPATFGAGGAGPSAHETASIIQQRGITCHIIPRGFVPPPERQPEKKQAWTWRRTSAGHAVPVQSQQHLWKKGAAK